MTRAKPGSTYGAGAAAVRAIKDRILPAIDAMNARGRQCTARSLGIELGLERGQEQDALKAYLTRMHHDGLVGRAGKTGQTNWYVADCDAELPEPPAPAMNGRVGIAPNREIVVGEPIASPPYKSAPRLSEIQIATFYIKEQYTDDPRPVRDARL